MDVTDQVYAGVRIRIDTAPCNSGDELRVPSKTFRIGRCRKVRHPSGAGAGSIGNHRRRTGIINVMPVWRARVTALPPCGFHPGQGARARMNIYKSGDPHPDRPLSQMSLPTSGTRDGIPGILEVLNLNPGGRSRKASAAMTMPDGWRCSSCFNARSTNVNRTASAASATIVLFP